VTWLPPDPTIPAFPPAIPRGYPRRVARDNCPRSGPPPSRAHTPQMRQRHLPVGHTRQRAVVSDTLAAAPARPRAHPAPPAPAGLALAVVCASSGKARRRLSASLPPMPPAHIGTGILCNACFHAAASCRAYRTTRIPWITRPPSALGRPPPTLDHDPAAGWITPWLPVKCVHDLPRQPRRHGRSGPSAPRSLPPEPRLVCRTDSPTDSHPPGPGGDRLPASASKPA
jgi:hypothetical protein